MKKTKQFHSPNPSKKCLFYRHLIFRRTLIYFSILWCLVLVSSLLYIFLNSEKSIDFWTALNLSLFYINLPLFSYALLSFVAQRGLFNGIRYSLKKTGTFFFKHHKEQMMAELSARDEQNLNEILKEKYLYTSPYSESTLPLVIASSLTFIIMVLFALL